MSRAASSKNSLQLFLTQASFNAELDSLERLGNLFKTKSELCFDVPRMVATIQDIHSQNDIIASLEPGPWTDAKVTLALSQLQKSVGLLPNALRDIGKMDIVIRSLKWETIRSYLTIYHWYDDAGPSLSETLFKTHQDEGLAALQEAHPNLAGLVDHIMDYVNSISKTKSKSRGERPTPSELRKIPAHMTGIIFPNTRKQLTLPVIKSAPQKKAARYAVASKCFLEFVSQHLIISGVKDLDMKLGLNADFEDSHQTKYIEACLVICGGTISRILKAFDNDDSILACRAVHDLILNPYSLFHLGGLKVITFAHQILSDPDAVFGEFDKFLKGRLADSPQIRGTACQIADIVWGRLVNLGTVAQTRSRRPTTFFAPRLVACGHGVPTGRTIIDPELSVEVLAKEGKELSYGAAALLIREVLAKRRKKSQCNQFIRRIMNQLSPTSGTIIASNARDIDHFNPVRGDNENTKDFFRAFPNKTLTTRRGGSAFSAWMCTGQGSMTREFQAGKNMVFSDLEECITTFSAAEVRGEKCTNTQIWGKSPCSWMKLSMKNFTIRDKFAPMYSNDFQDSWIEFLGNLAEKDPDTYTGALPPWWDMVEWIMKRNINCLNNYSLTVLQMANNAALRHLCLLPTKFEMAEFLANASKSKRGEEKGGIRGLELLGFNLSTRKDRRRWIYAAFISFYDHLDTYLSDTDKVELHFGAMFVEHLLCKIARYDSIFRNDKNTKTVTLESLANDANKDHGGSWVRGANMSNHHKFPIPLRPNHEELRGSIEIVLVSN
jgi:hypothetical protein